MFRKVTALGVTASAAEVGHQDLVRALTKVPRAKWKGDSHEGMVDVLNRQLHKMFPTVKPCSEWTTEELQDFQSVLYDNRNPELDDIYSSTGDNRRMFRAPLREHQEHWSQSRQLAEENPHMKTMQRDGHCHEAVMWLVHHLDGQEQRRLSAQRAVPTLAEEDHHGKCGGSSSKAESQLCDDYLYKITCSACHVNIGPSGVIPPDDPKPIDPAADKFDKCGPGTSNPDSPVWYEGMDAPVGTRKKRCDWDYEPKPVMCEAIGGIIWGDGEGKIVFPECEPIMNASDIPADNLTSPVWAEAFTVKEWAVGINQCAKANDKFGCRFPGSLPCASHQFLNETYYAEYYDGSTETGPRVTVHRSDGNIINHKNGNMYVQTSPGKPYDFCLCVGPAQDGLPPPAPVLGALLHDFAKDAILIGREKVMLEYLNRWAIADHWMKGPHNFWVEVSTNQMVRGWQAYNGLQIWFDWEIGMPSEDKFVIPEVCYNGFMNQNVSCRAAAPGPNVKKMTITGLMKGLCSDGDDVDSCLTAAPAVLTNFEAATAAFKQGEFLDGFVALSKAFGGIQPAHDQCEKVAADLAKLREAIGKLSPAELEKNFEAHKTDILLELAKASESKDAGSYTEAGQHAGMALRRLLEEDAFFA